MVYKGKELKNKYQPRRGPKYSGFGSPQPRYGSKHSGFGGLIKLSPESGTGIRHLRRDIGTGGRWAIKKGKKEYGKHKTLRGTKVYLYMDDDFVRYNVLFQDGSMYTMSENPLSPRGLSKYIGNVFEDDRIKPFGKKVNLSVVPREVKKAIKLIAEE